MNRLGERSGHLRLVLVAAIAVPVVISLTASPTTAALDGLTNFEIDSDTVVTDVSGSDWTSKFDAGQVTVSNDANFTGSPVVQPDVGSSDSDPDWLPNCPNSSFDSVFTGNTKIDDPTWVGDIGAGSVSDKNDICQSYFSNEVVPSGPRAGHIVAYIAFTRPVSQRDGDFHFILSKGPDPDVRVAGDVVIEAEYDNGGLSQGLRAATWSDPGPTLGAFVAIGTDNSNVEASSLGYFAEVAIDLTALGLAPNADDVAPDDCLAFGFGRVVSRTGSSDESTLSDDGKPIRLDLDVCGRLVIQKEITAAVPGDWQFPVSVTAPTGVTLDDPDPELVVPEGNTVSDVVTYDALPPRPASDGGYNVWEQLTGDLGARWVLDSILCVNDRGTESPDDDGPPTQITSPDDVFRILAHETVTCTITNSPVPAVINVDKDAEGGTGTWPVVVRGPSPGVMAVTDDGTIDFTTPGTFATSGPTPAGVYVLTETAGAGAFRVGGWSCSVVGGGSPVEVNGASIGITVNPGDIVNCTVTNTPVPPPTVVVTKSASPTSFQEPASAADRPIIYTVEVHNPGDEPFTIENLTDEVGSDPAFDLDAALVGDQAGTAGATIVANECAGLLNEVVDPDGSDSCQFSVSYTGRNAGDQIDDVVTAFVEDAFGQTASAFDDEIVTVDDVAPTVVVEKQNIAVDGTNEVVAPGGLATYSIEIGNPDDAVEPFTITSVIDTISTSGSGFVPTVIEYFAVGGPVVATDCVDAVNTVLAPGESVVCQFTIDTRLLGTVVEGDQLTNRVVVDVVDDDGTIDDGFDDADRDVVGEPPQLVVDKTDHDVDILEAADDIAYDITITNISVTEPLTITSITDAITFVPKDGAPQSRGMLVIDQNGGVDASGLVGVGLVNTTCDAAIGTVLAPEGGSILCTITLHFTGNADDRYEDKVTVEALDDEDPPAVATASNEADTPVVNVAPDITIANDAVPASVPETGGQVVYTLTVTNDSFVSGDPVTITELSDSVFGSFFPLDSVAGVIDTDCFDLENVVLQLPGDSTSCTITAFVSGQAGDEHVDNATVAGIGEEGSRATADDDAHVLFTDVIPQVRVAKSADRPSVVETGELVTFTVTVANDTLEPVVIDALNDDVFGDLTTRDESTCVFGAELEPDDGVPGSGDDTYTCAFTALVAQLTTELQHKDTVTVTVHDNDGNSVIRGDDEIVTFDLVPPTVELTKQDEPDGNATVDEPGGDVPYTIAITNTSDEPVRITKLTDTATYESPAGATEFDLISPTQPISDVDCSAGLDDAIAPQQTVSCTFVAALSGNAQIVRDQVDVRVTDNDGQTAADLAVAQVPILDVRPEVAIVKTADPLTISPGDDVTYQVVITNLSTVEEVALLTLVDDRFGDLFPECEQFGMATTLAPGASTTCEFVRVLDEAPDTTHTNIVRVTAADDETLANLATLREFQDDLLLPVSATSQASVLTVGPDLVLTKDDAAFVATAGQQTPFQYTITVVNVGAGEVNLADTVTVVDDLPDAFEWVAPAPSGCSINGQQLTCSIPAASLRPAGTAATIVAIAQLAPGADAGVYENRAYVTTPDDPVTTPPPCTDTDAVAADNNVACEPTEVIPPPPDVVVIKSASPTSFQEPATAADRPIVYTVEVQNHGTEPFTITDLTDAVGANPTFDLDAALVGDEAGTDGATIVANGCAVLIDEVVNPNGSDSCQFSVSYAGRNAGDQIDDVVSVSVEDAFDRTGSASDNELVTVDGVAPTVVVDKQNIAVGGTTIVAPGGLATYSIEIRNPDSAVEPFTITSVVDTISTTGLGFGPTEIDYFTVGGPVVATDCVDFVTPEPLAPGESLSCNFTIDTRLLGTGVVAEGELITNRVDVDVVDDDGTTDDGSDDADRDVVGEPPQLVVDKTDHGVDILEAEDDIAYDITITNLSVTEPLTITSITDAVTFVPAGGEPETRGVLVVDANGVDTSGLSVTLVDTDCLELINEVLEPGGGTIACTITLRLTGNADDRYEDTVTVDALDDENAHATASNEADTPVVNVPPAISIDNHPNVGSVPETGGEVVYTLTITNASVVSRDPVTITELSDSVFGSFFIDGIPDGVIATDCAALENHLLAPPGEPGDSVSCSFMAFVSGQAGDEHVDNVTVGGIGEEGSRATDDDDAHVLFTDVIPAFVVTKTADPQSVVESGELVTFTVAVENDTLELLTVDSLVDDVYGDLVDPANLADSTCESGAVLDPDDGVAGTGPDTYTCTFTVLVAQLATELQHEDSVTVTARDNDGNTRSVSGDEIVTFDLIPPAVELTKQDQPGGNATIDEPGGDVPYTITVTNTSDESVTITTLTETIQYEDPAGETEYSLLSPAAPISDIECSQSLAALLAPDQTVSCTFVVALAGNPQIVSDRVDVVVTDNDGQTAGDVAAAIVPILDVRPAVSIVKTADPPVISPGDEVTYKLVITNLSTVEGITVLTLLDDRFGNLLPTCEALDMATTLGPGISTTCQFTRVLDEAPGSTHTNIVTVSAADDETLVNLDAAPEFRDDSLVPVTATSQASVVTVGPDLELTKSDADFVATAGQQAPFTYTITVTNVGEGEVNLADAVTVVDDLPDAFEWVAPIPAGCTISGQQLTCSLAAASLRPAGTSATVVASARVAPGAVAGTFDNRAYATTLDDAVTAPPPCIDSEAVAADNNVDCETTPVASSITTDLASECVNNAPYINYDITPFGFTPSGGATLTFYDLAGNLVDSTHVAELTGRVLYPGAEVDAAGLATDWPGWKFENGLWVVDPSDAHLHLDGLRVVVEVNPISDGTVSYPGAASACADPAQVPPTTLPPTVVPPTVVPPTTVPPTTVPPTVVLPATGSSSTLPFVLAAFGMGAVGGLALLLGRRRGTDH